MSYFATYAVTRRPVWAAVGVWLGTGVTVTTLLALASGAGAIVVPVTLQQILDRAGTSGQPPRLTVVGAAVGVGATLLAMSAVSAYLLHLRLARRTEALLDAVRNQTFRHIVEQRGDSVAARSAKARRAVDDIDRVSHFVRWSGPTILVKGGRLLVVLAAMVVYSWRLAAAVTAVLAAFACIQWLHRRRLDGGYLALRRRSLEVRAAIVDLVLRCRRPGAYGERRDAQARAEAAARRRTAHQTALARRGAIGLVLNELAAGCVLATVIVLGTRLSAHRDLTLGQLVAVLLVSTLIVSPIETASGVLDDCRAAVVGWRRLTRLGAYSGGGAGAYSGELPAPIPPPQDTAYVDQHQ